MSNNNNRKNGVRKSKDQEEDENNSTTIVVDDPCWGTPTTCTLSHLLQHIRREKIVIYQNPDYLVLNKPPDLRMDGNYPATVHKLLMYWFPPPSLLVRPEKETPTPPGAPADQSPSLLERISKLIQYPDVMDNELRPAHQLDYATSGVLLVAKSKPAAARARKWFEQRQIVKTYSAVLLGHIPPTTTTDSHSKKKNDASSSSSDSMFQPTLLHNTEAEIDETMERIECAFRKQRKKTQKQTWQGYLPVSSIFEQWKQYQIKKKKKKENESHNDTDRPKKKFKTSPPTHKLNPEEWEQVWSHVAEMTTEQETLVLDRKWNQLQKSNIPHIAELIQQLEQATHAYNRIFKEKYWIHRHTPPPTLPTFFQLQPEEVARDSNMDNHDDDSKKQDPRREETIYIYGDLAEDEDQFSMRIPEHLSFYCPYLPVAKEEDDTTDRYDPKAPFDFKPSLTKCTILARSYIRPPVNVGDDGGSDTPVPVTYVSFEPKTGRRHQLRIHAALMGTPILGDCTYSTPHISPKTYSSRLCLHSQSLRTKDGTLSVQTESPFVWDPTKDIIEIRML
jgi:23S rRNA-/tRNA-specific pseudouridylate synthase